MPATPILSIAETQVNVADGNRNQNSAQITALNDGNYLVVWTDNGGFYFQGFPAIVARLYDQTGSSLGGEIRISSANGDAQNHFGSVAPAVTQLADGDIVIAFDVVSVGITSNGSNVADRV